MSVLTGAYQAVLQVSGHTANRLVASMHQNAWTDTKTPTIPHTFGMRVGDDRATDGIRGTVWGQVGAPRISLIDRSTDRFDIQMDVRMRYRPDENTTPLPDNIRATVRAQYVLTPISPDCRGWRNQADRFLWFRVDPRSVALDDLDYGDDDLGLAAIAVDEAELRARLVRQITLALRDKFEAAPQEVPKGFQRGGLLCLVQPNQTLSGFLGIGGLDVGGTAVALPVDLSGGQPDVGQIGSITNVLVGGHDLALALDRQVVMSQLDPVLAQIRAVKATTTITVSPWIGPDWSTVYRTAVTSATATWLPEGSQATIEISMTGESKTDSILPNLSFSATQKVHVGFDEGSQRLVVWRGETKTTAPSSVGPRLRSAVVDATDAAVKVANSGLPDLGAAAQGVVGLLKGCDANANAWFSEADFNHHGIIIRGSIGVSHRQHPKVTFKKVDDDTISALEAWIPGGVVDRFDWSWTFDDSRAGSSKRTLPYVLRRPLSRQRSKFGLAALGGREPVVGLDGSGRLCLTVVGRVVDPNTGALVAMNGSGWCRRFGINLRFALGEGSYHLRDYLEKEPVGPPGPPQERGLIDVSRVGRGEGSNTLVVVAERWDERADAILRDGLAECRRDDAGLAVLILLPDGSLATLDEPTAERLATLERELEAPVIVNEDVDRRWSAAMAVTGGDGPAWRLVAPDGGVAWAADGPLEARDLASVLDEALFPSPPPVIHTYEHHAVQRLTPGLVGALFDHVGDTERDCPNFSGLRNAADLVAKQSSSITFVHRDSASSRDAVRALDRERAESGDKRDLILVVDALDADGSSRLADDLGEGYNVIADPEGRLAAAFGVAYRPATIALAPTGATEHVPRRGIRVAWSGADPDHPAEQPPATKEAP